MLTQLLEKAILARADLITGEPVGAWRLFAGFYEGEANLVADIYGRTLVLSSYSSDPAVTNALFTEAQTVILQQLPWLTCVLQKQRSAQQEVLRRGKISLGENCDGMILEHGVRYALDLQMNQDASFYLDTCFLRKWLLEHSEGKEVLNTFAYTGSLGVAALAGKAAKVVQNDRNAHFLELARRSAMLNRMDLGKMKLRATDFFSEMGQLKKDQAAFDIAIIDPPFFSVTEKGKVDMAAESERLINKVRPLIKHGGHLVVINNALFLPGSDFMHSLGMLCQDGYLKMEEIIPVPQDITGFPQTISGVAPADPAPFNHSTKIAVLGVRRKDAVH